MTLCSRTVPSRIISFVVWLRLLECYYVATNASFRSLARRLASDPASCTREASGPKTLASGQLSRAVQWSQKRRRTAVVELDSQSALLPALRGRLGRRPTSCSLCSAKVHQQTRRSDARSRCFLGKSDTLVSAVRLERLGARTTSAARAAAVQHADSGAWSLLLFASRTARAVKDDGERRNTARKERRARDRFLKTTVAERHTEKQAGPKEALDKQSSEAIVARDHKGK